jgi:hypothetical protein
VVTGVCETDTLDDEVVAIVLSGEPAGPELDVLITVVIEAEAGSLDEVEGWLVPVGDVVSTVRVPDPLDVVSRELLGNWLVEPRNELDSVPPLRAWML